MSLRTAKADITFMNSLFIAAEQQAHDLGDDVMGPEHLVIAVLNHDNLDLTALLNLGLDADRFRDAVRSVHAEALAIAGAHGTPVSIDSAPGGLMRSTYTAQQVFQAARTRAKANRTAITPTNVLAAAARLEHGTTARAFAHLDIDREALEALDR